MKKDVELAIHEYLIENWEAFCSKAIEQGISEEFARSEKMDELIDEILIQG
tara:strand:+ start:427 stop:579 length:153 start_codon:yes stop_codon:yes gene_type:complete